MLTLKDCIDMSGLADSEIAAIAEHEHVPEIIAAEIGCKLVNSPAGRTVLKHYLYENYVRAKAHHLDAKANSLALLLRRFDGAHPSNHVTKRTAARHPSR